MRDEHGDDDMTEIEKWRKGLPFNSAKLWQEMDDDNLEKIAEGIRQGQAPPPKPPT